MNTNLRILIVENDSANSELIKKLLTQYTARQFDFFIVNSLSASFDILKTQKIDVILLGLKLPNGQGIETFREVNNIAYTTPIIILADLQDERFAIETIAEGAQDYLLKGTFDGNLLGRAIVYAIERKHHESIMNEYAEII